MSEPATSDRQPRPNMRTREDWLAAVLSGRDVTRISQHLALVIYHLADPATGIAKRSLRELEAITGWGRSTIADHLAELEVFMRIYLGQGRGKSTFEIECEITRAVQQQRVMASQPDATALTATTVVASQPDTTPNDAPVMASQPDATQPEPVAVVASQPDATVVSGVVVSQPDAIPDATPDTTVMATEPDAKPDAKPDTTVVASQPDAKPDTTPPSRAHARATKESPTEIVISSKLASLPRADDAQAHEGLNGAAAAMLSDIVGWMNAGDEQSARQWLKTFVSTHGQDVVKQSYLKLKTDMLEGSIVARPLAVWSQIAKRIKSDPAKAAAAPPPNNEDRVERMKRRAAEQLAKQRGSP